MSQDFRGSENPVYWTEKSVALRQSGELDAAIAACKRALAIAPQDASALSSLAHTLRWQGRFTEAHDAAGKAIEAAPHLAVAWFNYSASLEGLGRPDEAIAAYRRTLALKPDYAEAWSNLGNVLTDQKREDEALDAYRRAAGHNPNLAPIWSNLGGALRHSRRTEEAIDACRRATTLDPGYASGWSNLGLALHDQGQTAEAVNALRRAVALEPSPVAWQNLGDVLGAEGHLGEAERAYRQAVAASPPAAALLTRLGTILKQQGRANEAIDAFRQALVIDPIHVAALAEIGQLYCELKQPEAAERHYRTAVATLLAAIRAGDAATALQYEARIFRGFVQTLETEAHYRRRFSDWHAEMAALGARFRQAVSPVRTQQQVIAFFLHSGHVLGHTEVLLKLLEGAKAIGDARIIPRLYVFGSFDNEFLERVERLGVPLVLLERALPRAASTPLDQQFLWLRERLKQDRADICVWVSSPIWATFAFSMRLAPVQVFWALRFHPISGPEIDGHITWGNLNEKTRRYGGQEWEVVPLPFAIDDAPPDPAKLNELRRRFPEDVLLGTLAREEKINSAPFLRAVADILIANPRAGYLWTGRREHPGIAGFFQSAGVAERCHFVGWVDTKLYAAALDVFLESFPYGFGIIGYQAFAAGVPVLSYLDSYTLFGMHYWQRVVTPGADGAAPPRPRLSAPDEYPILCARDAQEYVLLAGRLIRDAAWRKEIGARGLAFFRSEFQNNAAYAQRFFATVARIAARRLGNPPDAQSP
ncbi:MAG: tetratricopeptide repeat protein [Betaproteobacteria bacterium]|nr:tetratricopeptide repeat protein [Betaproteobacteria bacterium]